MSVSFLTKLFRNGATRRGTRPRVGIDLGTHAIKLAGIHREGNRWTRDFQILIPRKPLDDLAAPSEISQTLKEKFPVQRGWRKRKSACVSSMSLVSFRQFRLPAGSDDELRGMVEAELNANSQEDETTLFDFWQTDSPERDAAALRTVWVISLPQCRAESLAKELMQTGFLCQAHDGLPFALARAVHLATPDATEPMVALDLGASAATFVVCHRGRPQYTRVLRGCELSKTACALASQLGTSEAAGWSLLADPSLQQAASRVSRREECLRGLLRDIVAETSRTFDYVKNQFPKFLPQSVQLLGAGGMVPLIVRTLQETLPVPVEPWRLDSNGTGANQDPVFAAAYAMSAWGEAP